MSRPSPHVEKLIDGILAAEGGYVDHNDDKGGCTNFGITLPALREWRGDYGANCIDLYEMDESEAREIYRHRYIKRPGFTKIDNFALMELVADCGVNHGTHRATRWLQRAAGAKPDGVFGPKTEAAVNGGSATEIYLKIIARRVRFYGRIVTRDHSQATFAAGWANRAARFILTVPGCER